MTYNPSIPQGSDNLSNSQVQILNNFGQLNTIFDANHYKYNDATTGFRGLHRKVDFPAVTTVSAPAGAASVLYPKDVSGVTALFFQNAVGDSTIWRGGSGNGLASATLNSGLSSGSFTFPNGVIFKWGYATGVQDSDFILFSGSFPTQCSHVQLTGQRTNTNERSLWVQSYTAGGVTVRTSSSSINVLWFAIGN